MAGFAAWLQEKLPGSLKATARGCYQKIMIKSLEAAGRQQGFGSLYPVLARAVPDLRFQYSNFIVDSSYLEKNIRYLHCFQISLINHAIDYLGLGGKELTIVDIGDSAGTHIMYLKHIFPHIRGLSVNLDPEAVARINNNGLEAIHSRAEDIHTYNIKPDIFLSFETLEHLMDPIHFLKSLADETECKALIVSVPYLKQSRIALRHISSNNETPVNAEGVHVFELSPPDWRLIFKHSGWAIVRDQIYMQYPRTGLLRLTRRLWESLDFEGFYGAILVRDSRWSKCYLDW